MEDISGGLMEDKKEEKMYKRISKNFKQQYMIPSTVNTYEYLKNKDRTEEWFESPVLYTKQQYDQFKKTNRVAGIRDTKTDKLWWDFDSKDLKIAHRSCKELVNRLVKKGFKEEAIQVKFSGNKGFHVIVNTDTTMSYLQAAKVCEGIGGDLEGFDDSVYLPTQLLRMPLTKHKKTGLYSMPLTLDELREYNIDTITKEAKSDDGFDLDILKDYYVEDSLKGKIEIPEVEKTLDKIKEMIQEDRTLDFNIKSINFVDKPKFLDNARYALQEGYFKEGERNKALLCLAATYKNQGLRIEHTYRLLKGVAELSAKRTGMSRFPDDEIWENIVEVVYGPTWRGGQFSIHDEDSWLYKYAKKYKIPLENLDDEEHSQYVMNMGDTLKGFTNYAENIDKNRMKFGIKELDDLLQVQVGHLVGILGAPSSGKSSMALTLLNNTSKMGIKSFFGSYDMANNIMVQKLIQREMRLTGDEIYDIYKNKDQDAIKNIEEVLKKNYQNVSFCFKVGQSIKQLKYAVEREEERVGEKIKLVVVDYLELVLTDKSDPTSASAEAAQGLREIANEGRVVVVLLQPNKMNSKVDEPILSFNAAKGSSAIAQAVTSMIGVHRPGWNPQIPENDNYFSLTVLKNRMGQLGSADFSWHGLTGKIAPLEDIQRKELKEIIERKKMSKEDEGSMF
jgi:KaiC/GvpD/RAD55 family RecA-like ATPase